jgi:Ca-activated chloride channel family protein
LAIIIEIRETARVKAMKVKLEPLLSDYNLDSHQTSSQRQLSISVKAIPEIEENHLPLNLCLILDHSGSMQGKPLEIVKKAAISIIEKLNSQDNLCIIVFDHRAKVLFPNQLVTNKADIIKRLQILEADGGTAIDEGLKIGIQEIAKGAKNTSKQIFLLTDGENEHGSNDRCLKLSQLASEYNITLNTLGFGPHWNQDILEKIADLGSGNLSYIEKSEDAVAQFNQLFNRIQSVGLTNAYLNLELAPQVRLAEIKPIAQVAPETIELTYTQEQSGFKVRLGDLMKETPREILVNLYIGQLPMGNQTIAKVQIIYDNPSENQENLRSETMPVNVEVQPQYQPKQDQNVQKSILALAKYRQTQIAEAKLAEGDRKSAATMLQTAAKTALQLGDTTGATVLQHSATVLQTQGELSETDKKKTRIASKTIIAN